MTIDWRKSEISPKEAIEILEHAYECLNYVGKTLPANSKSRLYPLWTEILHTTHAQALALKHALVVQFVWREEL